MSCSRCGTRTILWCLGCEKVQYCGRACQQDDWRRHVSACGSLIGAGTEGDDFIPMHEDLFWRKLAEKKLNFEQFLRSIARRSKPDIKSSIRRVFDPLEMERVRDIFGITREEMEHQAMDVALEEDSDVMFDAIIENGVPARGRDVTKAVGEGRVKITKLLLSYPGHGIQEFFHELIGEAARKNQEGVLRVLLADARFVDNDADKMAILKDTIDDDNYVLLLRMLLEDPQVQARFSKDDARKALEAAPVGVSKVLKKYIQV